MVLELAEEIILKAPEQWTIFHPIWPDLAASLALASPETIEGLSPDKNRFL